jgi:glycosyltransferase involved in cell wall biosynthesis
LQKFVLDLAGQQALSCNKVSIIVLESFDDCDLQPDPQGGFEFYFLPSPRSKIDLLSQVRLIRTLSRLRPDIVHTHGTTLVEIMLYVFLGKSAIFHTIHNMASKEAGKIRKWLHYIMFRFFSVTPVVISDEVEASFVGYYGLSDYFKIYNGCTPRNLSENHRHVASFLSSIKRGESTKTLINVGRIDEQKNQYLLVQAFNQLIDDGLDANLIILGDYYGEPEVYEEVRALVRDDRVHFIGVVDNVFDYLSLCDFFCLSSKYEGLPISLLEAMSAGLVCVTTPTGGAATLVREGIGYVSSDFTLSSYTEALRGAIVGQKQIDKQYVADIFIRKYTMERCCNKYLDLYKGADY